MGDRTQGNIEVVGGSPAVRDAIANVWRQYAYVGDSDTETILSGETYDEEMSCGFSSDAVSEIQAILVNTDKRHHPDRIEVYEDARYEWTGDLHRYQPALGWHHLSIDNSGSATIDPTWISAKIDEARALDVVKDEALDHLDAALYDLLGTAWDPKWLVGVQIQDAQPGQPAIRHLRFFHTREEAEEFVGRLPDVEDGLYTIDGPEEES